jgi:hypothetical protein
MARSREATSAGGSSGMSYCIPCLPFRELHAYRLQACMICSLIFCSIEDGRCQSSKHARQQRSIPRRGYAGGKRKGLYQSCPPERFTLAAWRSPSRRVALLPSWLMRYRRLASRRTAQRIQRNQPASGGTGARLQTSSRVVSLRQVRLNLWRVPDIYSTSGFLIRLRPNVKTVRLPQREPQTDV